MNSKFITERKQFWSFVVGAGLYCICAAVKADIQAVYIPANYPAENLVEVQNVANFQPLCSGLTGLDLARGALNLPMCPSRPAVSPRGDASLAERVDLLFMVNDSVALSSDLRTQLTQLNALQNEGGRATVRPSTHYVRNRDGSFGGRMVILGEMAYRASGSDTAWVQQVQRLAQVFERGDREEIDDEHHDMDVAFDRDFERFTENVMTSLCGIMLCRSDSREYMRTLIDRHPDLRDLHRGLSTSTGPGRSVRIRAVITRQHDRGERIADMRFAQAGTFIEGDDETVSGDRRPGVIRVMNEGLERARDTTRHISETAIRERMDCLLSLYNRLGNGSIYDTEREPFTAERFWVTNAFEGEDNYEGLAQVPPPPENHRYYPMREIYMASQLTQGNDSAFARELRRIDNNVYQTWYVFYREDAVAGGVGGRQRYGPNLQRLHDWIMQQQGNANSVYSCYGGVNNP